MTGKVRKNSKKRIILKWWQKILLIVGTTGLCVLLTWLLCEKWLQPVYVDTMRAKWVTEGGIDEDWDAYVAQLYAMGLEEIRIPRQQQRVRYR